MTSSAEGAGIPPAGAGCRPPSHPSHRASSAVLVAGPLVLLATLAETALGNLREGDVARRLTLFGIAFLVQFAAFLLGLTGVAALAHRRNRLNRSFLPYILVVALLARLVLLLGQPNLSDDLNRYLWEGLAQWDYGLNPYLVAPADAPPSLRHSPIGRTATHRNITSIYPPLTELTLRLLYPVARSTRGYRVAMVLFDLGTMLLLVLLLRSTGGSLLWVLVYAWHPLVLVEFAGNGHCDAVGIFLMMLAVLLLLRGREFPACIALGASMAAKYFSAPLLLFFWPRLRNKWCALTVPVVFLLLLLPYLPAGPLGLLVDDLAVLRGRVPPHEGDRLFQGLLYVLAVYDSNAGPYRALLLLTGETMGNDHLTRCLVGALVVLVWAVLYLRRVNLTTAALFSLGVPIALGRMVHPWYLTWLVPWLALRSAEEGTAFRLTSAAWLYLSGAVVASYAVLVRYLATIHRPRPIWEVPLWALLLQFVPPAAMLAAATVGGLARARQPRRARGG